MHKDDEKDKIMKGNMLSGFKNHKFEDIAWEQILMKIWYVRWK